MDISSLKGQLKQAITDKDLDKLGHLLASAGKSKNPRWVQLILSCEVLPYLTTQQNEWFWRQSLPEDQFYELINKIHSTAQRLLVEEGLEPGKDFSSHMTRSGCRTLLITKQAKKILLLSLPKERHSSLHLVIRVPKEVPHAQNSDKPFS